MKLRILAVVLSVMAAMLLPISAQAEAPIDSLGIDNVDLGSFDPVGRTGSGAGLGIAGSEPGTVRVEITYSSVTDASVRGEVEAQGGLVVGSSPGVLLVEVPVGSLAELRGLPTVSDIRMPVRVDLTPVVGEVLGDIVPTAVTEVINLTNAQAWHNIGYTGQGVRVGVVDFFDGATWSSAQTSGAVPAPSGTFCRIVGSSCDIWSAVHLMVWPCRRSSTRWRRPPRST